MTLTRPPDLISADRLPHNAMRRAETYLKRQMFKVENAAVLRQQRLYRAAYRDLRGVALDLADFYGFHTTSNRATQAMWRDSFIGMAQPRIQHLLDDVMRDTIRAAGAALTGAYYGRLWLLDMATREDVRIHMPMLRGNDIVSGLTEDVYSDLIQSALGKEWRQQYALELDDLTVQIRRAIGQGMSSKEDVSATMRRVSQTMGINIDRRRGSPGSVERAGYRANFNRVQTLTRTVVNRISNAAAIEAYKLNSDIVDGYSWLTANDELVCPQCRALDRKVFGFNSGVMPPEHFNCRCSVTPNIQAEALANEQGVLRTVFDRWTRQLGFDTALQDFLSPQT